MFIIHYSDWFDAYFIPMIVPTILNALVSNIPNIFDQVALKALIRGVGWIKVFWDTEAGDITEHNEETDEVLMEGDIAIRSPSTFDIWVDPAASKWEDAKYIFQRYWLTCDEAEYRFPNDIKILQSFKKQKDSGSDVDDREVNARQEQLIEEFKNDSF